MKPLQNTIENRRTFLLTQYAKNPQSIKSSQGNGVVFGILDIINNPEHYYFEGTPLSQITDEDAKYCKEILEFQDINYVINGLLNKSDWEANLSNTLQAIDHLRSKGYALPYLGTSVETQIEYGWIKLKE